MDSMKFCAKILKYITKPQLNQIREFSLWNMVQNLWAVIKSFVLLCLPIHILMTFAYWAHSNICLQFYWLYFPMSKTHLSVCNFLCKGLLGVNLHCYFQTMLIWLISYLFTIIIRFSSVNKILYLLYTHFKTIDYYSTRSNQIRDNLKRRVNEF